MEAIAYSFEMFWQQPNVRHLCKGNCKKLKLGRGNESIWRCDIYAVFLFISLKKDKYANPIVLIFLFFFCITVFNAKTLDLM
jgi:hypothetical protein